MPSASSPEPPDACHSATDAAVAHPRFLAAKGAEVDEPTAELDRGLTKRLVVLVGGQLPRIDQHGALFAGAQHAWKPG